MAKIVYFLISCFTNIYCSALCDAVFVFALHIAWLADLSIFLDAQYYTRFSLIGILGGGYICIYSVSAPGGWCKTALYCSLFWYSLDEFCLVIKRSNTYLL